MRPTISVVTPTHPARMRNGRLLRAAKSVGDQTVLPDAHCIAVDVDKEGAAPTRQRALMMAQTDWVAFLDSDDAFMPRHLEWLIKCALEREADFVYSWFKVVQEFADGTAKVWEEDPIFPPGHYLNEWDPENPIETTITTLVRTELAKEVGFQALDRGEHNSGEDRFFTIGCMNAGAKIVHLKRRSWYWVHHQTRAGLQGNTSGIPGKGDDVDTLDDLLTY